MKERELMKFLKIIITLAIIGPAGYYLYMYISNRDTLDFETVCEKGHKKYTKLCRNVGKDAWSKPSVANLNEKNFGKILGVAWRRKNSIISAKGQRSRRSESNSYYYIIGTLGKDGAQFLRVESEIDPR